jgi:nitrite reductase (NADH) small subunit
MSGALETLADSGLCRVGRVEDVPFMEGRSVTVGSRRIAVFRTVDGFRAVDAECPHEGGPLSDGLVADSCVTCPLHNWRIDLSSGEVVAGGEGRIETYKVIEHEGELLVRIEHDPLA